MGGAAGMCVGCGTAGQGGASGEGQGGAGGTDPALVHGTCDLRTVNASCLEVTDGANVVAMAQMTCLLNGGTWSDVPCPAMALVGCCAYSATSTYRDCSYSGAPGDPAAACAMIQGAVWTPAVAAE
jgi:hypothetical protein